MVKSYDAKVQDFAIKRGYIQTNPFALVDLPTNISKKARGVVEDKAENFYTRAQLNEFLSCLESENNLKVYEALALTWNDLDFKKNEIRINKALSRGKDNQLYLKPTKTSLPRTIKMDDKTMAVLKEWKKKQKEDYLKLGCNTTKPSQLVFSNEKNEFLQPTKLRKWILQVQTKYNLGTITTHGLRHTHCSLLFEAGASIKEVQVLLGHTDVRTTMNIYAHVTQQAKEEVILKFSNYVNM